VQDGSYAFIKTHAEYGISSRGEITMRLDKYLKVSRLIKRRTVANEACDAGRVLVNGKAARASYEVKPGDVLCLSLGARELKAEIVSVQETVAKNDAALLYRLLNS